MVARSPSSAALRSSLVAKAENKALAQALTQPSGLSGSQEQEVGLGCGNDELEPAAPMFV